MKRSHLGYGKTCWNMYGSKHENENKKINIEIKRICYVVPPISVKFNIFS
jgi:hypothetical protein